MAYIVDLVIVMNLIFKKGKVVSKDDIQGALEEFRQFKNRVHVAVRQFVDHRSTVKAIFAQSGNVKEIERLIREYTTDE